MTMIQHDVVQGSSQWIALRNNYHCASEAPVMMGVSPHMKRNELLHAKKTCSESEFSEWVQRNLLDKGHDVEAAARPIVEALIGEDLYRVTGTQEIEGLPLLASFDGLTMDGVIGWEHKLWNADLVRAVEASVNDGEGLDPLYWSQLEQQLLVSDAEKICFTVSDGTETNMRNCWYASRPERRKAIIAGWKQFDEDLKAYVPVAAEPTKTAAPVKDLPAIIWKRDGTALTHNLDVFRNAALQLVDESKKTLETDQDFVDCDLLCKKFKSTEEKIDLYKAQVLGEIEDVDAFSRGLTEIQELIRQARINGEKQITSRKEAIRLEILEKAKTALAAHIAMLNERIGFAYMPAIVADFAGSMKNKRTVASLRDAVDTTLARAKIESNEHADRIHINLGKLREMAKDHKFLFADTATVVLKPTEDVVTLINYRISEHKRKEEERLAEERAKIRAEEEAKAKAEAEAKLRAENEAKAKAEAEVKAKEEAERLKKEAEERAAADATEKAKRDAEEKAQAAAKPAPIPPTAAPQPEPDRPGPAAPGGPIRTRGPAVTAVSPAPVAAVAPCRDALMSMIDTAMVDMTATELEQVYKTITSIREARRKTA